MLRQSPLPMIVSRRGVRTTEEEVFQDYLIVPTNVEPQHPHLRFWHRG